MAKPCRDWNVGDVNELGWVIELIEDIPKRVVCWKVDGGFITSEYRLDDTPFYQVADPQEAK